MLTFLPPRTAAKMSAQMLLLAISLTLSACVLPKITRTEGVDASQTDVPIATDIGAETAVFDVASGCPDGMPRCGSQQRCVDLQNDPRNCGSCDNVCPARDGSAASCRNGVCDGTCPAPRTLCAEQCVDTATSVTNCRTCGTSCVGNSVPANAVAACTPAGCGFECTAGFARVGAGCVRACAADQICGFMGCVPGSGCTSVRVFGLPIEDLRSLNSSCTEAAIMTPAAYTWHDCTSAAHQRCMMQGALWGYGPVSSTIGRGEIVCVYGPTRTTSVQEAVLSAIDVGCTGVRNASIECIGAIATYCRSQNAGDSGWGPIQYDNVTRAFTFACIPPSVGTMTHFSSAELAAAGMARTCLPMPGGPPARSVFCDESVHRLCAMRAGFVSGVGPISGDPANGYEVLCLRGVVRPG